MHTEQIMALADAYAFAAQGYNQKGLNEARAALEAALAGLRSLKREPEGKVIEGYEEERIIHWRDGFMPSVGTLLYCHPAPVNQTLMEALRLAEDSLGAFVSDHGWSQQDMDNLDTVTAAIAQAEKGMK